MLKWFPVLWGNLTRRKARTLLTMVSVVASFILFGLLDSFRHSVETFGDDYANALIVQSRNVPLPFAHVARVRDLEGITAACGVLLVPVLLPSEKRAFVQGVSDPDLFEVHPGIQLASDAKSVWRKERMGILVEEAVAAENGWKIGDRVMLAGSPRRAPFARADGRNVMEALITGIFSTKNTLGASGIFAHYEYLRDLVGSQRAGMEYIVARFDSRTDIDRVRDRIDAVFENSDAPTKTYSNRALMRAYYGTFRDLSALALVVVSVSFVTLLLISGSVLLQAQRERVREVAVLEALGVPRPRLAGLFAAEAFGLIAPSALAGLLIAGWLARKIDTGVALSSGGLLPVHSATTGLLFVSALVAAIAFIPCVRMMRAPVAVGLNRE